MDDLICKINDKLSNLGIKYLNSKRFDLGLKVKKSDFLLLKEYKKILQQLICDIRFNEGNIREIINTNI